MRILTGPDWLAACRAHAGGVEVVGSAPGELYRLALEAVLKVQLNDPAYAFELGVFGSAWIAYDPVAGVRLIPARERVPLADAVVYNVLEGRAPSSKLQPVPDHVSYRRHLLGSVYTSHLADYRGDYSVKLLVRNPAIDVGRGDLEYDTPAAWYTVGVVYTG
jgi:hypothetical protein